MIKKNLTDKESIYFWSTFPNGELKEIEYNSLLSLLGEDWWNAETELSPSLLKGEYK